MTERYAVGVIGRRIFLGRRANGQYDVIKQIQGPADQIGVSIGDWIKGTRINDGCDGAFSPNAEQRPPNGCIKAILARIGALGRDLIPL